MLTVDLDPDTEKRLTERALRRGMSNADLVRTLIEESLDDLDDIQMATERLSQPIQPLTSDQAHKALGLDD